MNGEVVKSYLVSLSADTNMASFAKFEGVLTSTGKTVANRVSGIVGDFLKLQIGVTSAFDAAGFAAIGYIDHLAMVDQRTKMLAMQNGMSVGSYRAMSNALDVMGVSLTDVYHGTKQMQEQFAELVAHQQKLNTMIGPDYEAQMDQVMRVHTQFQKLELDAQAFGMRFASDLLKKSGFGNDGLLNQLERLNDWVMKEMPKWSDEISTDVMPILYDLWDILKGLGGIAGDLALEFTNVVGVLSGDTSIEGATFNFHKFAKSVEIVVHWMALLVEKMLKVEHGLVKWAPVIAGFFGGGAAGGSIGGTIGSIIGGVGGIEGGPVGILAGAAVGGAAGTAIGGMVGGGLGAAAGGVVMEREEHGRHAHGDPVPGAKVDDTSPTSAMSSFLDAQGQQAAIAEAQRVSKDTGVPANLILGQWEHETGKFTNRGATELNNLAGIRYPGSTEYRDFASFDDFGNFYAGLLKSKRYTNAGVLAAKTPEQFAHSLKAGGYYKDTERNYAAGIARYSRPSISVTVNVGPVNNADPGKIAAAVKQGTAEAYQQHMAQLNGAYGG